MEELLGRQPPHSAPAEQAVIGAMLIDPSCIPDVIEKVKSDEFYIQANRDIFDTIFAMFSYGQSVDAVTVLEQMKVRGVYKDTTQQYLMEVMQVTPTAATIPSCLYDYEKELKPGDNLILSAFGGGYTWVPSM